MNIQWLLLKICLIIWMVNDTLLFSYQSPDWILFEGKHEKPVDYLLLNDNSSLLVLMGTSHFTLPFRGSPEASSLITFDFLIANTPSVVKRTKNRNIAIGCKQKHFLLIEEDGTKIDSYNDILFPFNHYCHLEELKPNLFVLSYPAVIESVNTHVIKVIQYDPNNRKVTQIHNNTVTGETIVLCNMFVFAQYIICVYNSETLRDGQLYTLDMKPRGFPFQVAINFEDILFSLVRKNEITVIVFYSFYNKIRAKPFSFKSSIDVFQAVKTVFTFTEGGDNPLQAYLCTDIKDIIIIIGSTETKAFIIKITYDFIRLGSHKLFDVYDSSTFAFASIAVYNENDIALFSSQTNSGVSTNYVHFITDANCKSKEYLIKANSLQVLTELVDELSSMIKQYMVVIKKAPNVIIENTPIELNAPFDIEKELNYLSQANINMNILLLKI